MNMNSVCYKHDYTLMCLQTHAHTHTHMHTHKHTHNVAAYVYTHSCSFMF